MDPTPRLVSDEDHEAAVALVAKFFAADYDDEAKYYRDQAARVVDLLISNGWGLTRQIQVDALRTARDAAREARRLCWAEGRDEHTIRHWGATAGWLASRAKKIQAGKEPDWPDAAYSTSEESG